MRRHKLSEVLTDYAVKTLTAHEVDPSVSNGHEFQGVNALRTILGTQRLTNAPCTFVYLPGDAEAEEDVVEGSVSWYDSREGDNSRSAEWRLYYDARAGRLVQSVAREGDLFALAKLKDGRLIVFLAANGSTRARQLLFLFSESHAPGFRFEVGTPEERDIGLAEDSILLALGIETPEPDDSAAATAAEKIFRQYSGVFPSTEDFSASAQASFSGSDAMEDPDGFLIGIMEWEEALFRLFEEKLVAERLEKGFQLEPKGYDVKAFLSFARSIGNRRFSRAGWAFEHHVRAVLVAGKLAFEWHVKTEGERKPDFIFPSGVAYHNPSFPAERLRMLGTKRTCKDRWRQVINEAARIKLKHLLTLEAAISEDQTSEMRDENVQLVVPKGIQATYSESQRGWLKSFAEFLAEIRGLAPRS